jgi:sulfur-carrier protein adenylyltransferase/sulfurtransferase
LLSGQGYKEVYNLKGGIKAWQGLKAVGPVELNLDLIQGDESPVAMIEICYGMEETLRKFYLLAGEEIKNGEVIALLKKLGDIEERHKQLLLSRYAELTPNQPEALGGLVDRLPQILEGGFKFSEFLIQNRAAFQSITELLDLAMMIETQALDLYLRFAMKTSEDSTKKVLYKIADEEKGHLEALGKLKDKTTLE